MCILRVQGHREWYHYCTTEKDYGSFLGEMSGAVYNVRLDSHTLTDINVCCIIAHRSPPVDQQNSASTVETNQSEVVLPSSDVEDYSESSLRKAISRIVNPRGSLFGYSKYFFDFFVYRSDRSF